MGASADEPFGVKLLRPDSLAGWDHGISPPVGWTITDGKLSGKADSTPLLSGFTAGDFELRFRWSVAGGGAWKVLLPQVPSGNGLELVLREGEHCGQLTNGNEELVPGGKVEPIADGMHTATIRRAGRKFSLAVDDKRLYEVDIQADRRFGLGLAVVEGEAALAGLRWKEPDGRAIFNGKDLAGWLCPGNLGAWKAENDELVLHPGGGNYIRTEKQFANFTLELEYKMKKGGNSGIAIRTPPGGWPSGDGMELQLDDHPGISRGSCFAIYGNMPPLARADKSEQYNHVVVKADGWMISVWCNGELIQQCNTLNHPELKHRYLTGWIGFQDHNAWIRIRNLRVLEAPDGRGLDAWYQPRNKLATGVMVDRLMNSERLSVADGITSGAVAKTITGDNPAEHVLAELTGPGAVVRVARSNDHGRLAFYFDGEDKPRVECNPGDLWRAMPEITEDSNPVPTCLAYRKSLKVVLRDAKQAAYRFDFVTFPEEVEVETFRGLKLSQPRGWLEAAVYRSNRFRYNWAGPRENDPMPRLESERKTVGPGKTEQLIHVEDTGIVHWLRLNANARVLASNDLWLEVSIDGQSSPAISAPARYWFPGLIEGGNYRNFVLVSQNGKPTNVLAMPFADGIAISARNCGDQPIDGVSAEISVQHATDQTRDEITGRMRLRGVFQPAQDGTNELINQQGAGRWVALVYQEPEGEQTGIAQLAVDGKPADGWPADDLDAFLGRSGDFRAALSGRTGGLCWRYLLLAPVEFQESLVLKTNANKVGDRLVLFYLKE